MRTKALFCLAAAAAIAIPASAQVYSANIVGYVNVPVAGNGALSLISNPLKPSDGNYNITNTVSLPDTWVDANIYKWAGTSWSTDVPAWYGAETKWFPDMNIPLGEAFFLKAPPGAPAATVTFVGEVQTGEVQNTINPGLSFLANKFPVAEPFPGKAVGNLDDNIYLWNGTTWDPTVWTYYGAETGWFGAGNPGDSDAGPVVAPGSGILYRNGGAAINWAKTFNP